MEVKTNKEKIIVFILVLFIFSFGCSLGESVSRLNNNDFGEENAQIENLTLIPNQPIELSVVPITEPNDEPTIEVPIVSNPAPFICAQSGTRPDLVVEIVSVDKAEIIQLAEPWTWIRFTVTNYGSVATPDRIDINEIVNGERSKSFLNNVGILEPCQTVDAKFAVGHQESSPPGHYTIEIIADVFNKIPELDETNNLSNSISFEVISP